MANSVKDEEIFSEPEVHHQEQPDATQSFTTSSSKIYFTLDDIPYFKWPDRLQEFHAWLTARHISKPSTYDILLEFTSRFTGALKDWWHTASEQDQMYFLTQSLDNAI
ncbi:hypothetical protein BT93_C1171 [Corymbia citriodora subsp. variegata]|nr:hypothetical protein BT93_C1171 [Corymbia citriodora subsp. variegata]